MWSTDHDIGVHGFGPRGRALFIYISDLIYGKLKEFRLLADYPGNTLT